MYFKRIAIKNWGGLYDSELSLGLDEQLNVVVGPNESGKSTTLEAIRLALTTKASSRKQAVKDAQPWNTDLKPRIDIEFYAKGKDYRLEKTYLKTSGNASFSERLGGDEWTTLAEDDAAHSRFLDTLDLTESEEFFRALWVPQGENLELEVSEGLQSRVEEAVGSATSELGERVLGYAVNKVGDPKTKGWLTKKRRNPRSGSPWKKASEKLEELREQLFDLQKERENHFHRLEEIGNHREKQDNLEKKLEKKKEKLENYEKLKEEWDEFRELKKKAESAEERYKRLMKFKQDWDDQIEAIEKKNMKIDSLEEDLEELAENEETLKSKEKNKRSSYESTRDELEQLKTKRAYLRRLRAQLLNNRIEELETEIENLGAPDPDSFEELRQLHEKLSRKRSQLEASELSINFSPNREVSGKLTIDGEEQDIELDSEETMDKSAAKFFELMVDDLGSLRVETGMERALEVKEELESYQKRLHEGFQEYDVGDWEELKKLHEKAEKHRNERDKLSDLRDNLELDGTESIDEKSLEEFREKNSEDFNHEFLDLTKDLETAEIKNRINQLGKEIAEKNEILEEKQEQWKTQKEELEDLRRKMEKTERRIENETRLKENEIERLTDVKEEIKEFDNRFADKLSGIKDSGSDFDREAEENCDLYGELKAAWGEARDEKDELSHEAERRKPSGEEVTEDTLNELEAEVDGLQERLRELEGEINRLQGRIGDTADGLHDRIRSKKEEIRKQERQLESHRKETRSHELLRVVLEEAKAETSRKYVEPVKEKVIPRLREMTGNRYEGVKFGTDLKPDSTVRDRRSAKAKKAELSFGTREQLSFLTRLAMAEVIGEEERIPVIFDDSLVNTDSDRMKYARRFLKEASESCQIILFTCHGEDYSWENEVNKIELDELP